MPSSSVTTYTIVKPSTSSESLQATLDGYLQLITKDVLSFEMNSFDPNKAHRSHEQIEIKLLPTVYSTKFAIKSLQIIAPNTLMARDFMHSHQRLVLQFAHREGISVGIAIA